MQDKDRGDGAGGDLVQAIVASMPMGCEMNRKRPDSTNSTNRSAKAARVAGETAWSHVLLPSGHNRAGPTATAA